MRWILIFLFLVLLIPMAESVNPMSVPYISQLFSIVIQKDTAVQPDAFGKPPLKLQNTDYYSHEARSLPYSSRLGDLSLMNPNRYNINQNYSYANFGDSH